MPTSPVAKAVAVLNKSAANLRDAHKAAVTDAAQEAKKVLLAELEHVAPGRRLKGVGKSGAKLGVGYEVTGSGDEVMATVKARGPWQLIERGIHRHTIRPRRKRALTAGPFGVFAQVTHPGVHRPKKPFEKGHAKAGPKVEKILAQQYIKAVTRAWG